MLVIKTLVIQPIKALAYQNYRSWEADNSII